MFQIHVLLQRHQSELRSGLQLLQSLIILTINLRKTVVKMSPKARQFEFLKAMARQQSSESEPPLSLVVAAYRTACHKFAVNLNFAHQYPNATVIALRTYILE